MSSAGRSATDRPALSRCIAVSPARFAEEYWGRQPLLSRAAELPGRDGGFFDLLNLEAADELLSRRGMRSPFLRVARDGEVVNSGQFTGSGGVGAEIGDQVRDEAVMSLFREGSTLVLQALHRIWPPIIDFVTDLSAQMGHPVQANAYITPEASKGFAAHYDVHDVFVLQLTGRKSWTVHAPVHPDPLRSQPWDGRATEVAAAAANQQPVLQTELGPGDALYLPRGYLHAAETGQSEQTGEAGISAHLTLGIHTITRYAMVEALSALVAADPQLRRSLPMGVDTADPEQLAPQLEQTREALIAAVRAVPAERVARAVRESAWSGNRPEPLSPIRHATDTQHLQAGDVVRLRRGVHHRLYEQDEEAVVELADRTMRLPVQTLPALRELLAGGPVSVGSLPQLDEADQLTLVRRLLSEAVLVYPPS